MAKITTALLTLFLFTAPGMASAQMSTRDRLVFDHLADQINRYTQSRSSTASRRRSTTGASS
ncbi:MAG: hypothetical protein R2712_20010 [Vicinamibacterales bacterium]